MKIESLQLTNFRSYQDAMIDFSGIRLASIVGPMGAGKSSIMDAARFALYGSQGTGTLNDWIRDDQEECRVSLTFSLGSERYRITRTRSRRNKGTSTVDLVRNVGGGAWVAECTGATETDARIKGLLGADEELLLMTGFIAQTEASRFLSLSAGKRIEALSTILRLDEQYGPLEKHFKAEAETHKTALGKTRTDIERLEIDAVALTEREDLAEVAREALGNRRTAQEITEQDLAEAQERSRVAQDGVRDAEEAQRRLSELTAHRDDLAARRTAITTELARAKLRTGERDALTAQLSNRPALEEAIAHQAEAERADAELRQRAALLGAGLRAAKDRARIISDQGKPKRMELDKAVAVMSSARERITAIEEAETPVCDRCGQEIEDDALDRTLEQLRYEFREADLSAGALQVGVEQLREDFGAEGKVIAVIEADISTLPAFAYDLPEHRRLQDLLEHLNEIPAKLAEIAAIEERSREAMVELHGVTEQLTDPERRRELDIAQTAVDAATERSRAVVAARLDEGLCAEQVTRARQDVSALEQTVARHEEAIDILRPSLEKLTQAKVDEKTLEVDLADALFLGGPRGAFSKWGIPSLIIGNVLQALEVQVAELIGPYNSGMTVRFAQTTTDGLRDSLEIIVDRDGVSRQYESYSGGEKFCVSTSIRLGLALLLAHRSGARIETLIFDEPDGLDAEGRQALVTILERLSAQFGLVLLISHHEDLKEAFPSQILVTRGDDGLSAVEVRA